MIRVLATLLCGLLFGLGLLISGMANPRKVQAFLDLAGAWDPSLMLVMAGAIGVAWWPFQRAKRRTTACLGEPMQLPERRDLDGRLIGGSLLFGLGWGLSGFCPGPAILAWGAGASDAWLFVPAMLLGMALCDRWMPTRDEG